MNYEEVVEPLSRESLICFASVMKEGMNDRSEVD